MSQDTNIIDSLTGAYSRAYLTIRLNEELKRAVRYNSTFSILLVDLDYFKSINDAFGHLKGDQVLVEFANLLKSEARNSDLVFRYGGDEFVILMPFTSRHRAVVLSERLLDQVRLSHFGDKKSLNLTMSCGIATFPGDGSTAEDLFEAADQNHYHAKRCGRDCVIFERPKLLDAKPLEEITRLIERDEGMSITRSFIEEISSSNRSVLRIAGESGLGVSRFLQEVSKVARLSGFGVFTLHGSSALEKRKYSVLVNTLLENSLIDIQDIDRLIYSQNWLDQLNAIIAHWLDVKGYSGLVIILENILKIDRSSLDNIKACFYSSLNAPIGLVYADSGIQAQQLFPYGVTPKAIVDLHPISPAGMKIWLRQSLHWDPPQDFVEWFMEKSRGYPAVIQSSLEEMVHLGVIKNTQTGISLAENFRDEGVIQVKSESLYRLTGGNYFNSSTEFVGRHSELNLLKRMVLNERLLSITGMGGVGKSRLAYQVALESQEEFLNGSLFVPLLGVTDSVSAVYILADALGFKLVGKLPEREQLVNFLFHKEILILLDGVDQLREEMDLISYILENTLAVRFLVTARDRLNLRHESVFELSGLQLPKSSDCADIETYSSIQLFLQVARRGRPDFQIQQADWFHIFDICEYLQGVPLGIELAASWMESLNCEEISAQLKKNRDLTSDYQRHQESTARSLNIILLSLWERFSVVEQESLIGMSIFKGGFSRHAVQTILGVSLFFVDALISKSILRHMGQDRYFLHELINQLLQTRLDQSLEVYKIYRDRHAEYYLELVEELSVKAAQSKDKEAYATLSVDIENLRSAWNWTVQNQNYHLIQPIMQNLFLYFEQGGRFREGKEFFLGLHTHLLSQAEQGDSSLAKSLLAITYAYLGKYEYHLGDYPKSEALLSTALNTFEEIQLQSDAALTTYNMANLKRAQGDYEHARELLTDCLAYYKDAGDLGSQGDILNSLGVIASGLGDIDLAEKYYLECLKIFQELEDSGKVSRAMNNLGYSYIEKGDHDASLPLLIQSLELSQDIGSDPLSASILDSLGLLHYMMGDYSASLRYYRDGLRLSVKLNALPLVLEIILGFAMVYSKQGKIQQAAELMSLVYRHPSSVFEIRERSKKMLQEITQDYPVDCLDGGQLEITSLDVDHTITNILYTHFQV